LTIDSAAAFISSEYPSRWLARSTSSPPGSSPPLVFANVSVNAETREGSTPPVIRIRSAAANSTSNTPVAAAAIAAAKPTPLAQSQPAQSALTHQAQAFPSTPKHPSASAAAMTGGRSTWML
jgi:hypothetical protein